MNGQSLNKSSKSGPKSDDDNKAVTPNLRSPFRRHPRTSSICTARSHSPFERDDRDSSSKEAPHLLVFGPKKKNPEAVEVGKPNSPERCVHDDDSDSDENEDRGSLPSPKSSRSGSSMTSVMKDIAEKGLESIFRTDKSNRTLEPTKTNGDVKYDVVEFHSNHYVYPVEIGKQRVHAKTTRSRPDIWRRYGSLMEIHRLGGYVNIVTNGNKKQAEKKFVAAGTPLPPIPKEKPIFTLEEFIARPVARGSTRAIRKRAPNPLEDTHVDGQTDDKIASKSPQKKDGKDG